MNTGLRILLRGRNSDGTRSNELKDITALCGGIQLSGAVKSASRKMSFNTLRKDKDYYLSQVANVRRGDAIALSYNGDYIFYGIVWNVKDNDSSMQKTITCYDNMKFLMTSDVITNIWNDVTAAEVTQTVCKELGVTCGDLPETDVKISVNARNKNGYEAIMIAWTETKKTTGKVYYPKMEGYKLNVIEKGTKLEGHSLKYQPEALEGSLISVELEEDSEDAVTSLWKRNSAGTATWVENDDDLVNLIGYIVGMNEDGQSTDEKNVKEINDGSKICNVSAVGDWYMQTGWSVPIASNTITEDLLYIESDVHYYENGIHTMDLELSYENSMDEMVNEPIETASTNGSVFGTGSIEEQIWNFLRANGFSAEAAAGVMGNMYAESNCTPNIEEYGGGGGFGLCQWTASRRTDLVNWCANNGYDYKSLEGQLNFMLYEVETYNMTYIKTISSVEEATRVFLTDFERAGIVRWSVRINAANDYYSRWKDYTTIPTASAGGGTVSDGSVSASQQSLINAAYSTPSAGYNLCATWVTNVFRKIGINIGGNGNDMTAAYCHSTNLSDLKPGMIIGCIRSPFGSAGYAFGHIAIYVGNDTVLSSELGTVAHYTVNSFSSTYGAISQVSWGWAGNVPLA